MFPRERDPGAREEWARWAARTVPVMMAEAEALNEEALAAMEAEEGAAA